MAELIQRQLPYNKELLDTIPGFGIIKNCLRVDPAERPIFGEIAEYLQMLIVRFQGLGFDEKRLVKVNAKLKEEKKIWLLDKNGYETRFHELTNQVDRLTQQLNEFLSSNDE
eukprot:TRINITY_DN3205_c0_g3_i1.p2 TRINITY_DN3205_c0_g3~~TRINITY_DN3205_c0_g3_i1.p2  ORF type:complete len:112 (+),score=30.04 TRINITY_DN3205_c0_g3_i1:783-1118(+)